LRGINTTFPRLPTIKLCSEKTCESLRQTTTIQNLRSGNETYLELVIDKNCLRLCSCSHLVFFTGGRRADDQYRKWHQLSDGWRHLGRTSGNGRPAKNFSLLLKLAAKSGKYLGDSSVTVTNAKSAVVFEGTTDGPWLFMNLPSGNYKVTVKNGDISQSQKISIGKNAHRDVTMYWNVIDNE
jgi:hypothetical protein